MINLIRSFLILILLFTPRYELLANNLEDFDSYMQSWEQNRELASQYLEDALKEFKAGDELTGCATQQQAGEYGIKATESLIKAIKTKGNEESIPDLEAGLNKWRELRDSC